MNSKNILIGAVAGLAIGTLVGALISRDTDELYSKGMKGVKGVKKALNKFMDEMHDKIDYAKEEGSDLMKKGRAETARAKEKLESALN